MNRKARHCITFSAAALSAVLSAGCFTGIESTPRITDEDVRHANVADSPERRLFSGVTPERPSVWSPGKRFIVTDPKIALVLNPEAQYAGIATGDTLSLSGSREITSVTGNPTVEFIFDTSHGTSVTYRSNASADELTDRDRLDIPFTIELSLVEKASALIEGKELWITTPDWYDTDGNAQTGRKFIAVTITGVTSGNSAHPLKVTFTDKSDGSTHCVFMTAATESRVTRTFDNLFSLTDPRENYPSISDHVWQNIINGHVELYMTREECRLAIGPPTDINRTGSINGVVERWTYGDGIYLFFEDGVLTRFRR